MHPHVKATTCKSIGIETMFVYPWDQLLECYIRLSTNKHPCCYWPFYFIRRIYITLYYFPRTISILPLPCCCNKLTQFQFCSHGGSNLSPSWNNTSTCVHANDAHKHVYYYFHTLKNYLENLSLWTTVLPILQNVTRSGNMIV